MLLKQYLSEERGRAAEIARSLGISPVLLSQWSTDARRVPADRCPAVERATDGAVRCEEMRPDVDWAYLRGTVAVDHDETPKTEATSEAA
jgi:DNA-binding transcriptional regulator YdaS (Cro superfamily)